MISKVLTKTGIKKGNDKAPKNISEKMLEPSCSEDIHDNNDKTRDVKINIDENYIENDKDEPVAEKKKAEKTAIDLDKIKRRTKHLRTGVDILMETIEAG
jgi:hypothetical protein